MRGNQFTQQRGSDAEGSPQVMCSRSTSAFIFVGLPCQSLQRCMHGRSHVRPLPLSRSYQVALRTCSGCPSPSPSPAPPSLSHPSGGPRTCSWWRPPTPSPAPFPTLSSLPPRWPSYLQLVAASMSSLIKDNSIPKYMQLVKDVHETVELDALVHKLVGHFRVVLGHSNNNHVWYRVALTAASNAAATIFDDLTQVCVCEGAWGGRGVLGACAWVVRCADCGQPRGR
jgi:hypothetical protein